MSRHWMPLYIADYRADTCHLSTVEHGAYILLIMHYWSKGGLPSDNDRLARIVGLLPDEWLAIKETIATFFNDDWTHSRIDKELSDADEAYERRASAGRKGGLTKQCLSNAQAMLKQCSSNHNHNNILDKSNILPPTKTKIRKALSEIAEDAEPTDRDQQAAFKASMSQEQLSAEWQSFKDYHRARANRMADWAAAWRTWVGNHQKFKQPPRAGPKKQTGLVARATLELKRQMEFENGSKPQAPGAHEAVEFLPFRTING